MNENTSTTSRRIIGGSHSTTMAAAATSSAEKSKSSDTIRWGIIGLGDVCQKKSGPAFYKCRGSELVAVMRRTPGKAAAWAKENVPGGNCVGYDNVKDFLAHPLDAVYISTRPGTHLELCHQMAAAGKAVYIEKPVGRCAQETMEMVDICQKAGVRFYTAYISRAYERSQAIRQLLQEGAIGDCVTRITYKLVGMGGARGMDTKKELPWRLDAKQSGGGLIMDVGCHVLDRIDYLCGPLTDVVGNAKNKAHKNTQDVEDYVHLDAKIGGTCERAAIEPCKEGATVSCTWDFSGQQKEEMDELVITGPKGSLRMAGMTPNGPIQVLEGVDSATSRVVRELNHFAMPEHTAQGLIQAVTDDLRGVSKDSNYVLSRGDNAIRTSQVIDAALSSYYGGREKGYWDRSESWPGKLRAAAKEQS